MSWQEHVRRDPLPWLLDGDRPAVRAATLERLLGAGGHDRELAAARTAALRSDPIAGILAAQQPGGWWAKPGPGYAPKYTGTVWQVIFLDQLGADPADERVQAGCVYVLRWSASAGGGFGASGVGQERPAPPSRVIHCLTGNLVAALVRFGHLDDEPVQRALTWSADAIIGNGEVSWYASGTPGPGFACAGNLGRPCAWGAIKQLRALARVPEPRRTPDIRAAIDAGVGLLLSCDPAVADYPRRPGDSAPSRAWFRLGFPSGYACDVLETLEVLAALGHAADPRLAHALEWLEAQQDLHGRWHNSRAYTGKTWVDVEPQGVPSPWVTLRACCVLQAAYG